MNVLKTLTIIVMEMLPVLILLEASIAHATLGTQEMGLQETAQVA